MKKFLILMCAVLVGVITLSAKGNDDPLNYQIEGTGSAMGNTVIVKVTIVTKNKDKVKEAELGRAAVHGVLFRGYSKNNGQIGGSMNNPPMMKSPMDEQKYAEFFQPFFDNNIYAGYVQCVNETRRTVKVGKEWKVSCEVRVSEDLLRKDLQDQGILKDPKKGW